MQLHKNYDKIKALDGEILSIHREEREGIKGLAKTIAKTKVTFPVLLDYENKATMPYSQGAFFTFLIDKKGVIKKIIAGTTYDRPTGDAILGEFEKMVASQEKEK